MCRLPCPAALTPIRRYELRMFRFATAKVFHFVVYLQLGSGAWYFDELSRTATIVLRPLNGVSPTLQYSFTLCTVANGCLPSPRLTAPVTFGAIHYWYVNHLLSNLCIVNYVERLTDCRSDTNTWLAMNQVPPTPGADVTIMENFIVVMDTISPVLGVVRILGSLIFSEDHPEITVTLKVRVRTSRLYAFLHNWSSMQATHVIVTGGLYIGDVNSPFPNNASILLFGDRTVASQVISGVDIGAKVWFPSFPPPCFCNPMM